MIAPRDNFTPHAAGRSRLKLACAAAILACLAASASAQYREDHIPDGPPLPIPNPGITAKPNAPIPLDLEFTRSDGTKIKLGELFNHNRPVVLTLVYLSCPLLCGMNQDYLVSSIREGPRGLKLGQDYDVIVVSIDPDDTPEIAATKRANYLAKASLSDPQPGFTYLTGKAENVKALADAVGFGYFRNQPSVAAESGKYAHSLATFISTPFGRLSQTLVNQYTPDELHNALSLASEGKIGTISDRIALGCGAMRLNPLTGKYEQNPWFWVGTAGGLASMTFMAIFLGTLWRGEFKKNRKPPQEHTDQTV